MENQRNLFLYFQRTTLPNASSNNNLPIKHGVTDRWTASPPYEYPPSKLPEYPVAMAMKDVGPSLGPQLMDKIGDVIRFIHKDAITAFAGADPGVNDSGDYSQKSVHTSKHSSTVLRKTLFQIMNILIKIKPNDAVYLFMDKKRSEGKPYYVYMTAGVNKFLRIYYGRMKKYLSSLPESE